MHVRAPLDIRFRRFFVAGLASGAVISLTALTGGIAPAYAKPHADPVVPTTTTVAAPEPEVVTPEQTTVAEVPSQPTPKAPAREQAPPSVETQASQPPPSPVQTSTAAVVAPSTVATPTAAVTAPVTSAEPPAPRVLAPSSTEPAPESSTEPARESSTESARASSTEPAASPAKTPASQAPATVSATATESASATESVSPVAPSAALVAPSSALSESASATATTATTATTSGRASGVTPSSSNLSQAAAVIETPQTLQAPKADLEVAKTAKPVEAKPEPAPKNDVASFASAINLNLGGRDGINAGANADLRLGNDRAFDRPIRQWSPDWVQYDEYYRPMILNPYHAPVRVIYVYDNAPRIVWIPPLARIVLDVAQFAAYSFTAAVFNAVNTVVDLAQTAVDVAQTAVDVAVGTFFGGGYFPGVGLPAPPPPPPVWRYDNVPVQVRYSDAVYEPFRVRRIVDVGDDSRYGERKVLLDGATPAWGVWTQTPSGERQFEIHRTQQFPGLDTPREAPLPGDYQMRLVSDDSSKGLDRRDIYLIVAAAVVVALGFGAIGMSIYLGRRRPQH